MDLTWESELAWGMVRHQLLRRRPRKKLLELVASVCGFRTQILAAAGLADGARVENVAAADLESDLWQRRTLLKTWAVRATLHLLPAAAHGLWQGALNIYNFYLKGAWVRGFKITQKEPQLLLEVVPKMLGDAGKTRRELADALARVTRLPVIGQ